MKHSQLLTQGQVLGRQRKPVRDEAADQEKIARKMSIDALSSLL
jgi:hypothetical protein